MKKTKIRLTGNFTKTQEALDRNYPSSYSFDNEEIEVEGLRRGVLIMFFWNGDHYYGDRKYCTIEEI